MANGETESGAKVRPDRETKIVGGIMYAVTLGVMGFLALQIWGMNTRLARVEVHQELSTRELTRRLEEAERKADRRAAQVDAKFDLLAEKVDRIANKKGD